MGVLSGRETQHIRMLGCVRHRRKHLLTLGAANNSKLIADKYAENTTFVQRNHESGSIYRRSVLKR